MNKASEEILSSFEEYLQIIKALEPKSIEAYLSDLYQLQKEVDNLIELDSETIFQYLLQFENKRTLNRKLASINTFINFCHYKKIPTQKIHIPMAKIPKSLPKYLSFEEIKIGLSLIDRNKQIGKRDYALILFLYASGCRISEALSVQREDLVDGWLRIRYAKGAKDRVVPIAPLALEAIDSYLKSSDISSPYIWLNYRGEKLSRISAYKITKKYLGVSPHVLRHSFASALILGGADLRVVQELLGHSSLNTTQIYTHIEPKHLYETVSKYHPLER